MTLYNRYIYVSIFLFLRFSASLAAKHNDNLRVIKSGVDAISSRSVALKLYAEVLNNSTEDFDVELSPTKCCLEIDDWEDCEALDLVIGCFQNIRAGETKTLNLVAPLISPVNRRGYCRALIHYKRTNEKRSVKKNITINFNTATHNKKFMNFRNLFVTTKLCDIDEDPLNDCKPVNCETYYNGKRSYYDTKIKRCVEVPECVTSKVHDDLAGIIYDPAINKCKDSAVKTDDINYVKEQSRAQRHTKGNVIIKKHKQHVKPVLTENETPHSKDLLEKEKIHEPTRTWLAINSQCKNKVVPLLIGIIIVQCCFLCSIIYFIAKNCSCIKRKKLVSKYFNHRQDVSVTTPLIATSNIDTDTTDYQFISESSNVDKKIKCYKACQDKVNNAKISLSDDILSKCLHRRDWSSKPVKSEAVYEYRAIKEEVSDFNKVLDKPNIPQVHQTVKTKTIDDGKVYVSNEKWNPATEKKSTTKSVKTQESSGLKALKTERTKLSDSEVALSEKEIKCHSYNFMESNVNCRKTSLETYNTAPFNTYSQQITNLQTAKSEEAIGTSASAEKGAQASFSYDSIDDYLSERGMSYLVGENISKYSISSYSNDTKQSGLSRASSKTSKNNIIKNVLSLLIRKKKLKPASYPQEKSRESLNLQLLHMSNASVYSSSNNESDYMKTFKRLKDSRSTL